MDDFEFENEGLDAVGGCEPGESDVSDDVVHPQDNYFELDIDVCPDAGPESYSLTLSDEDIDAVSEKSVDADDGKDGCDGQGHQPTFGRKCCPTRHGCQGATDCDYTYGAYPF